MSSKSSRKSRGSRTSVTSYSAPPRRTRSTFTRRDNMAIRSVPRSLPAAAWIPPRNKSELKYVDLADANYSFYSLSGGAACIPLNLVQAGPAVYNRNGARIEMKSVRLSGFIYPVIPGAAIMDRLRILIVYDRQNNGTLPAVSDILAYRTQTGTTGSLNGSLPNLDQKERYIILRDHHTIVPSVAFTSGAVTNVYNPDQTTNLDIDMFIPLKGLGTHFKSTADPAVIGNINSGALYMIFMNTFAANDAKWQCSMTSRLRFEDK